MPQLASAPEVAAYFRGYKGHRFASTKEAVAMSEGFRRQVFDFAERTHSKRRGAPKVFRCLDRELDGPLFADSARWRRL